MGSWSFDNRDADGNPGLNPTATTGMVSGPDTPPLGSGSAHLATGNGTTGGDGSAELRDTEFAGVKLSDLTALSYSTYDVANNGSQFPFLGLVISTTGDSSTTDDILFFEPPYQTAGSSGPGVPDQGPTAMNTWQTWNAFEGGWWDNNNICGDGGTNTMTFANCIANFPDAVIGTQGTLGGIRLDVGIADPMNTFDGNVDNFTIGFTPSVSSLAPVAGVLDTFNFDPDATTSPVPEPPTYGLVLAGAALVALAKLRSRSA
jgi:hypothetical protein